MSNNRVISTNLNNKIYAVVETFDDLDFNQDEKDIIIFFNEIDYEDHIKSWEEEQIYTGRTWKTIYLS